jgi:hypothetical protein
MLAFLGPILSTVGGFFKGKQDIEKLKISGKQNLKMGKQVSSAEWEALGVAAGENSWKDEYVTLIVTLPIPFIFVGNVVAAFTGDQTILLANTAALKELGVLMDTSYGQLVFAVCLAAIGLKSIKGMFK